MIFFWLFPLLLVLGCESEPVSSRYAVSTAKLAWSNYVASGKAATNELRDVQQAMEQYERTKNEESALQLIGLINRLVVEPVP